LKEVFKLRRVDPFSNVHGGVTSANDYGWAIIDPASNNTTKGVTQAFPNGEIWGINSAVFVQYPVPRPIFREEMSTILQMISVEGLYVKTLMDYIRFAVSELGLHFPLVIEVGAVGLKGAFISVQNRQMKQDNFPGPFRVDEFSREYVVSDGNQETILDALRQYFDELYDQAECVRSKVLSDEDVRSKNLPFLTKI
jgi:hypothetical protein